MKPCNLFLILSLLIIHLHHTASAFIGQSYVSNVSVDAYERIFISRTINFDDKKSKKVAFIKTNSSWIFNFRYSDGDFYFMSSARKSPSNLTLNLINKDTAQKDQISIKIIHNVTDTKFYQLNMKVLRNLEYFRQCENKLLYFLNTNHSKHNVRVSNVRLIDRNYMNITLINDLQFTGETEGWVNSFCPNKSLPTASIDEAINRMAKKIGFKLTKCGMSLVNTKKVGLTNDEPLNATIDIYFTSPSSSIHRSALRNNIWWVFILVIPFGLIYG